MNLNSRHANLNEINEITRVTIDLNKKIADKLRVNSDFIMNKIDLDKEHIANELLNKKRKADDAGVLKEEKRENNYTKTRSNKNATEINDKESFKIELSLKEDNEDNQDLRSINLIESRKNKKADVSSKKSQNYVKDESNVDGMIKSKWSLRDRKKNEFVSTDKITMILKDKNSLIDDTNKTIKIDNTQIIKKNIPVLENKKEEINNKLNIDTESDSDSDSESQIEIPDIF